METPNINTKKNIIPKIYAYRTPNNLEKQGWFKIGYTERDVNKRIKEQTYTVGITPDVLWDYVARFNDGYYFNDHDFHAYLTRKGIPREKGTEWFDFDDDVQKSKRMATSFIMKDDIYEFDEEVSVQSYELRKEQKEAVEMTASYFTEHESGEFLWNAKPRFGKTLSTYDLIKKLDYHNVLVLTNRPAVGNSWVDDYEKFIKYDDEGRLKYHFVSDSPAIKARDIISRDEYQRKYFGKNSDYHDEPYQIAFVSLQDLKGSKYFGGDLKKLGWVKDVNWDLIVIDESHEAVDTDKTEFALDKIKRKYILHLSGTPFKQIASDKFTDDQIFNWSYMDEQEAKENWDETATDEHNPYQDLPILNMYTYQMSNMIVDQIKQGADLDEETNVDYAFDLNEFFSTDESGRLIYKKDILKWLDALTKNKKYPFSTPELRNELKHTLWMLDRVDSVRALVSILRRHEVFKEYEIISVAGDGKVEDFDGQKYEQDEETVDGRNSALERVKNAIKNNDKTITLTVGQLTTGVTVPEWTGVLMLSNVQSPALYMQTGFRSQNPYKWSETAGDGNLITYRKENAYLFDFDPERSLGIVDDFANNLISDTSDGSGTQNEREDNIKRLLNFFPVIGEDTDGEMVELDPKQVLAIPRSIKIREVVRRGFMSNLLFNNISAIFRSEKILDIIHKFPKSEEGKLVGEKDKVKQEDVDEVQVDAEGNIEIDEDEVREKEESIFGIKVFATEEVKEAIQSNDLDDTADSDINEKLNDMLMDKIKPDFMKMRDEYDLTHREREQKEAQAEDLIKKKTSAFSQDLKVRQADHRRKFEQLRDSAKSEEEIAEVEETIEKEYAVFIEETYAALNKELNSIVKEASHEVIREQEEKIEKKKKDTVEDTVRENLRGFSRSIPSFIMAYGDENLTLENFDDYVDKDVFEEVTGITLDEFRFLRDGDTHIDENGDEQYFEGGLFNENVFDGSIQEFLNKRSELSDYFEDNEESIYDYIPPQNTNQIYTPEWVVKKMVNQLEDENPGIYDDSSKTFIDLYMKSGLYITEVVKKLYNSEVIKSEIPDDYERLKHILENQVYGLAPTEIIYRIASNFIFSEQTEGISHKNFVHLDAYPYAEAETLEEKLDEAFE